jgi:hypothetical protein
VIRAWRRSHSWADARKGVRHATADFLISGIGAIVIVLIVLFVWFFVNDAPTQIESLREKIVALSPPPPTALVDKWLLVLDNSAIKALVPAEMFEDWETKKHTVDELTERLPSPLAPQVPQEMLQDVETKKHRLDDLIHQREELAAQQLGYGKNPPSPSADIGELNLEVQRAQRELTEAEARVSKYVDPMAVKATNERNKAEHKINEAIGERNETTARVEQYLVSELLAPGKLIARGIPNEAPPHDNEQIIIKPAQWQYLRLSISTGEAADDKGTVVFKGVEIGKPRG